MTLSRVAQVKLPPDVKGKSILDFLAGRFTYLSRDGWQDAIQEGRVTIDGIPATLDAELAWNQILRYFPPDRPEPSVCTDVKLLFDCPDYVVLDKPANLPCHPAGAFFQNTLWALLKEGNVPGLPPMDNIHFVSRIDRETSGIVLIAKTPAFHTRAAKIFRSPETVKKYRVIVHGEFPPSLTAQGWLFHDPNSAVEKKRAFSFDKPSDDLRPETASTDFVRIRQWDDLTELEATLHTGRFHQIRATLCSLGYPVLGDKLYGLDETIYLRFSKQQMTERDRQLLRIPRQALHAYSLAFLGQTFIAPMPL